MYTTVSVKRGSRRLSVATGICPGVRLGGVGGDGSAGDGADSAGGATGSAGRAAGPIPTEVARTISSVTAAATSRHYFFAPCQYFASLGNTVLHRVGCDGPSSVSAAARHVA